MGDYFITKKEQATCILMGLVTKEQGEVKLSEYLDELAFLAETAHAQTVKRFIQKLDHPHILAIYL